MESWKTLILLVGREVQKSFLIKKKLKGKKIMILRCEIVYTIQKKNSVNF